MMSRMRLTKLRPDEVSKLTEREIKTMPEFRYSITRRRPTPEEIAKGESDGEWKVRIVSKDLKCKKKKPAEFTHSKVPSTSDFRLLCAFTNLEEFEVWMTDFKCAFLQSFDWEESKWRVIKIWDPDTKQLGFYLCCGVVYGDQEGSAEWKATLSYRLIEMGFVEIKNAESVYYHKAWGIRMSVHVDDPLITFDKSILDYARVHTKSMCFLHHRELDYIDIKSNFPRFALGKNRNSISYRKFNFLENPTPWRRKSFRNLGFLPAFSVACFEFLNFARKFDFL